MRALVVDDSAAMRRIQQKALAALGWEVAAASNGREAFDLLAKDQKFELMVTDWHMPEMDGIELVKAVRKEEKLASLKILMVTSETVLNSVQVALEAGVNDVVLKPFTADALAERVADVMCG